MVGFSLVADDRPSQADMAAICSGMPKLQRLTLEASRLSREALEQIHEARNLRSLSVCGISQVSCMTICRTHHVMTPESSVQR